MIFDTDDLHATNHRLDILNRLKVTNPAFRMTAFCVQGLGTPDFFESLPDWIECAAHGEFHPDPREAENWSYEKAMQVMDDTPERLRGGWKSPGWQISDGTYQALLDLGWWCADQPYNDGRRPKGLRVHRLGDGDHVHTHVQDVCGNGLQETWPQLVAAVSAADSFELVSDVVQPWA